ncbi:PTS system trehalose-specific EIIBC component [Saccharibacillus sp. CPCC 101409]|uniref:PTS system trehalose-specific EIIBC component n=1 Tax=Saccharibacillus sp. CPCC 101409 TaxID=3058041 RepID=UPI0026733FFC|nr:PTS system trehalose-specific EIIBC component [Saccharibacillus sp. CPCC 101409]MDO3412543.1 PTS system trehalose-specific EIIBC component [Saccharibacillus sp. CPCC 101409]
MSVKREDVEKIVEAIGGKDNIEVATHCVTRLRFSLVDESRVDKQALDDNELAKGYFSTQGQFQVIIGPGIVDKAYEEMIAITGGQRASKEDVKAAAIKHKSPVQQFIKTLSDIFIPLLPALVTAGLLLGINNLLTGGGIFFAERSLVEAYPQWADFAAIVNTIASTAFTFLPALVGWSAATRFGGSPLLGVVLGLILVNPGLMSAYEYANALNEGTVPTWNLFGLHINAVGYQGQVLPMLVAAYVLVVIEKWLNRKVPDSLKLLLVAPIALLVTGFLAFIVIGPVTFTLGNWLTEGVVWLFATVPWLGGLLYGGLYAPLVITGMHHTFLAVDLQLINSDAAGHSTFLWPMLALSNIAQGAAALSMMFVIRSQKMKSLSATTSVTAFLGVTEPAVFGVNVRYKYPLFMGMLGSAIGGVLLTMNDVRAFAVGVGGLPGFLAINVGDWGIFFIGMAIALVVPFVGTLVYGKIATRKQIASGEAVEEDLADRDVKKVENAQSPIPASGNDIVDRPAAVSASSATASAHRGGINVLDLPSPIKGEAVLLSAVPDPAFAEKQMGDGIAIEPSEGKVYAPFDGTVAHVIDKSKHAVILEHPTGVQILVHVGIDTVGLKGSGFKAHVATGDIVEEGQVLLEFDMEAIKAAGYPTISPVIVPVGQDIVESVEEIPGSARDGRTPVLRITLAEVGV